MESTEKSDLSAAHHHDDTRVEAALPNDLKVNPQEVTSEAVGGTLQDLPPHYYRSFDFIGTVAAVYCSYLASYAGFNVPANVRSYINEDIGPDPSYPWISIVWPLTSAVGFLLMGRLSDLFGRRWFCIVGDTIGLVGSIVAARAQSIPVLIGGTTMLGLAVSVQLSYSTILSELVPNKYRSLLVAAYGIGIVPLSVFGPVIIRAWILHTDPGWRWSYYLAIILNGTATLLFYLCYHPPTYSMLRNLDQRRVSKWKMLDSMGILLFTSGLVFILLGLSWGGSIYPWRSGMVIGFLVGGFVILVLFVLWEIYGAGEYPLVPMKLFLNRGFVGMLVTAGVGYLVFLALTVLWPVQLSALYTTSTMDAGWMSIPINTGAFMGVALAGLLIKSFGWHKWQLVFATGLLTTFTGAMAATTPSTPGMGIAFVLLAAIGLGYVENAALSLSPFCLKEEDIGMALGLIGTARSTFSSFGQAVFETILTSKLTSNVPRYVVPAVLAAGLPESSVPALLTGLSTGDVAGVPGVTSQIVAVAKAAYQEAYSQSFKVVYLSSIAFGICAMLAALAVPDFQSKLTDHIARRLQDNGAHNKTATASEETARVA